VAIEMRSRAPRRRAGGELLLGAGWVGRGGSFRPSRLGLAGPPFIRRGRVSQSPRLGRLPAFASPVHDLPVFLSRGWLRALCCATNREAYVSVVLGEPRNSGAYV
jgi:hypothetical protein